MAPGRRLPASSTPSLQERKQQSARDKAAAAAAQARMRGNAQLRSIPRGPPKKKAELFTQGALKSVQLAPRGHGYYDAFAMRPETACVSATTGPATVITGHSSDTIPGRANVDGAYDYAAYGGDGTSITQSKNYSGNSTLIAFNPGSSDNVVAKVYHLRHSNLATTPPSGPLIVDVKDITVAQFDELGPAVNSSSNALKAQGAGGGHTNNASVHAIDSLPHGRVESIPLRGSLRIRNITENLSVGGVVRCLRYNGGIHFGGFDTKQEYETPTADKYEKVCAMIRDSQRTKVINGHELRAMHQSNTYPADFVRSMQFETDTSFEEAMIRPGYCTLFILIDDFFASTNLTNNTYEINVNVQRAARFGFGTLLHGMARQMPLMGPEQQGQQHKSESGKPALNIVPHERPTFATLSNVNRSR